MKKSLKLMTRSTVSRAALLAVMALGGASAAQAATVTWTNSGGSGAWNSTDANWSGAAWVSGADAVFGATGIGAVNVNGPVTANNVSFLSNGYVLGGNSALTFTAGNAFTSSAGWINTGTGVSARINTAIVVNGALVKGGTGALELAGPISFNGAGTAYAVGVQGERLVNDLIVSGISSISQGGTLKIMNSSVLPSTTRVGIGNGVLDLGANNITIGALNFVNQSDNGVWNPLTNSAPLGAVIGTGTLRVLGDINVMGVDNGNGGPSSIATNLDLGGGTQVIRTAMNGSAMLGNALILSGTLSNGSLLKTFGYNQNGVLTTPDGMTLLGNNTYTGSTVFNGGSNVITGTNASSSVKVYGTQGGIGSTATLQGANGSYQSAGLIQAAGGGVFIIDNNAKLGVGYEPTVAAAQNNDRIRDDAVLQLNNGAFIYRGLSNTAASETLGKLDVAAGHNLLQLTANGTGSVTLTAGELALGPRSTLQISSTTLGGTTKFFVAGNAPAVDATGIVRNVVGTSDFLGYNASTGFTPITTYASSFVAGTNVALTAASTLASSTSINALKATGTFTTTIASGQTLSIDSGMVLAPSGTATFSGGTIAFGNSAGTFFGSSTQNFGNGAGALGGGNITVNSAITGTQGLINASSKALILNGDLSGLSGDLTNSGTTTLGTNSFAGAIYVRSGAVNLAVSQNLAGQGAVHLGDPGGDANLIATPVVLGLSAAGANAVFARDIIVDTGMRAASIGTDLWYSVMPQISPLSNGTGSQTISGKLQLNTALRIQGGGGSGTGSTNFTGNIAGSEMLDVANGRVSFSGNVGNAGGIRIGESGFTAMVTFAGTTSGSAPLFLEPGNKTELNYMAGALPTGVLTIENSTAGTAATITALNNSTINNTVNVNSFVKVNVGADTTAAWNGQLNGNGTLTKIGAGTLILGNAGNTYSGPVAVSVGTLQVNGALPGSAITVAAGATLAPGVGVGSMSAGSLALAGVLQEDIDVGGGAADLLSLSGGFSINGGSLSLALANPADGAFTGTYLLASLGGSNAIAGSFSSITGLAQGYSVSVNYAFSGTDSLGRIGDGNDLAVTITAVPEPTSYAMLLAGGGLLMWLQRRRKQAA